MKKNLRLFLWACLLLGLILDYTAQFVMAEQLNALGQLITKGSIAYIDNTPIPSGTTVLAGDKVRAINAPALISLTNGGRVELTPNTTVSLSGEARMLRVTQTSGKARFYVPNDVKLTLVTPRATVKTVSAARGFSGILSVDNQNVSFVSETGEFTVAETKLAQPAANGAGAEAVSAGAEETKAASSESTTNKTTNVKEGESVSVSESGTTESSAARGSGTASTAGGTAGTTASTAGSVWAPTIMQAAISAGVAATSSVIAAEIVKNNNNNNNNNNNPVVSPSNP